MIPRADNDRWSIYGGRVRRWSLDLGPAYGDTWLFLYPPRDWRFFGVAFDVVPGLHVSFDKKLSRSQARLLMARARTPDHHRGTP